MLGKGKGKRAALILAMLKDKDSKKDEPEKEAETDEGESPGGESAMKELSEALERGDWAEAFKAFRDAHELACEPAGDESKEDEDEEA